MAVLPVEVTCTADTWVIAAAVVTTASIKKKSVLPGVYLITTVPAGGAAPLNDDLAWGAFTDGPTEAISDSGPIDVYIKAVKNAGSVIVVK